MFNLWIILLFIFYNIWCIISQNDIVETNYGPIKGLILEQARVFRSIPYAKPPINNLRWKAPEIPNKWISTLDCTNEVVGCPQNCTQIPLDATECPVKMSEDCLYLNIWTPKYANQNDNYPILLFIHGGSFKTGYGGGIVYNGTQFANFTSTILVTINYRLGALGFFYDDTLDVYGNFGYLGIQVIYICLY